MIDRTITGIGIVLAIATAAVALSGCSGAGTPTASGQKVIDVLCARDAQFQPLIVPVVLTASPLAGPAAPALAAGVAADQVLVHPAVVAACAQYASKPASVVSEVPAGAVVATPVAVATKP